MYTGTVVVPTCFMLTIISYFGLLLTALILAVALLVSLSKIQLI